MKIINFMRVPHDDDNIAVIYETGEQEITTNCGFCHRVVYVKSRFSSPRKPPGIVCSCGALINEFESVNFDITGVFKNEC